MFLSFLILVLESPVRNFSAPLTLSFLTSAPIYFACLSDECWPWITAWVLKSWRTKSRGLKGLQLGFGDRRAPIIRVDQYYLVLEIKLLWLCPGIDRLWVSHFMLVFTICWVAVFVHIRLIIWFSKFYILYFPVSNFLHFVLSSFQVLHFLLSRSVVWFVDERSYEGRKSSILWQKKTKKISVFFN